MLVKLRRTTKPLPVFEQTLYNNPVPENSGPISVVTVTVGGLLYLCNVLYNIIILDL